MDAPLFIPAPLQVKRLNLFERYLSLWVALCIVVGVALGRAFPGLVSVLRASEFGEGSHINALSPY
jgi:ACR3 family arsenite transporter